MFRGIRLSISLLALTAAMALTTSTASAHHASAAAATASLSASSTSSSLLAPSYGLAGPSGPAIAAAQSTPTASLTAIPCDGGMAGPYECDNVDLESVLPLPALGGVTGNDIWGWTDPETAREYAVMGTSHTTAFIDVTDPQDPVLAGTLPTESDPLPDFILWRDVKVVGNYAFIVSEVSGSGLQVFDLTQLRDVDTGGAVPPLPEIFSSTATFDGFDYAHNIAVNEETDFAYAVGSNKCNNGTERGGLYMIDISDPLSPSFEGCALVPGGNNYVHDAECVVYDGPDPDYQGREICVNSNEDVVAIHDVTDKSNPVLISTAGYPTAAYTHQGWLTEDQGTFLFGDELDEQEGTVPATATYILDVSDLDNPGTPIPYFHDTVGIDHNLYIHGNRAFESNYTAGLRILDFDSASLAAGMLDEVGYFDVVPGVDVAEFAGSWSVYRFPDSETIVLSAVENEVNGLFVLKANLPDPPCDPALEDCDPPCDPEAESCGPPDKCEDGERKNGKGKGHDKQKGKGHTEHGNGNGYGHTEHCDDEEVAAPALGV